MNTGLDEILEASTYLINNDPFISRYLIKFSTEEISEVFTTKIKDKPYQINLRNYLALAEGLNRTTELYFYPVSGSWDMGTGQYLNSPPTTNGVSWKK